ncbi:hypothetical protein D3C73_1462840 [compost metagenome]
MAQALPATQDQHLADFAVALLDMAEALIRVEHHRVERREADDQHLGKFAVAEPHGDQRNPAEHRHLANGVEQWSDQPVGQR